MNQNGNDNGDSLGKLHSFLNERGLVRQKEKKDPWILTFVVRRIVKTFDRVLNVRDIKNYKTFSNLFFSDMRDRLTSFFAPLKDALESSDIDVLPNTYLTLSLSTSFLAALGAMLIVIFESTIVELGTVAFVLGIILMPMLCFLIVFAVFYMYPFQMVHDKAQNIKSHLPFAINHLAAIASAGVPPVKCFEMLAEFEDYGDVSKEAGNIVRRVDAFGEDITQAIKYVAKRTPSRDFKDLLYGVLSVIESGGNLKQYLNEMAQLALFNYKLSRRKYIKSLSNYADIYTAILIAAPLFLVSIMSVMNIVPSSGIKGISINYFMSIGIYVLIPLLNVAFLIFLSYSQPEI